MAAERLNMALQAASGTATLGSTITVVDAGGKVVKTSKHLFSAFKEARNAYRARKAEIAEERACQQARRDEARLRAARKHSSSRRLERSVDTTALITEDDEEEERRQLKREKGKKKHRSGSSSSSGDGSDISFEDDSGDNMLVATNGSRLYRSPSTDTMRTEGTIYSHGCLRGNMSAMSLIPEIAIAQDPIAQSLQALLMQLQATIDELSCLSAGLAKLISELQKVPDTLAVVAMTLAEAAAMVAKISPVAIMGLKTMFPMVFALLSSPQFTVLAGVGVAATVVVLGGYKIIRNAVAGAPANASVSNDYDDDDSILEYGEWREPIEEIPREPPPRRVIEDAHAQNERALQRRDGVMNVLAFNLSSETSASAEEDKGRHRKHSDKTSEPKPKSKSPKPEKKDTKDKDRKGKDKDRKGKDKDKDKDKKEKEKEKEKHKDRERKPSVSSSSSPSAAQKEKKPFFSLSSSPASSTTSLSSSGKKKERKSSVSALSSSPPKEKDGKKSKEAFMGLFEGRSA